MTHTIPRSGAKYAGLLVDKHDSTPPKEAYLRGYARQPLLWETTPLSKTVLVAVAHFGPLVIPEGLIQVIGVLLWDANEQPCGFTSVPHNPFLYTDDTVNINLSEDLFIAHPQAPTFGEDNPTLVRATSK